MRLSRTRSWAPPQAWGTGKPPSGTPTVAWPLGSDSSSKLSSVVCAGKATPLLHEGEALHFGHSPQAVGQSLQVSSWLQTLSPHTPGAVKSGAGESRSTGSVEGGTPRSKSFGARPVLAAQATAKSTRMIFIR